MPVRYWLVPAGEFEKLPLTAGGRYELDPERAPVARGK